ncbi:MAG: hypothetical protein RBS07_16935 [Lentimicrobium sp.]|jgi:hypothetical protein|nr:hypothetical protein [Lentimicrobium sp.]
MQKKNPQKEDESEKEDDMNDLKFFIRKKKVQNKVLKKIHCCPVKLMS